jgi:hypothetical protein
LDREIFELGKEIVQWNKGCSNGKGRCPDREMPQLDREIVQWERDRAD